MPRTKGAADEVGIRASAVDRHVGNRILERRLTLGLSLQQFAMLIGVTYQQAHKYERGFNRITAGRLYKISSALAVPVSWFFEGFDDDEPEATNAPRLRMSLELARNFASITNEKHQEALSHMARVLASQEEALEKTKDK
jgi:transcriptional regulator with XRE-family HTH domain